MTVQHFPENDRSLRMVVPVVSKNAGPVLQRRAFSLFAVLQSRGLAPDEVSPGVITHRLMYLPVILHAACALAFLAYPVCATDVRSRDSLRRRLPATRII